MEEPVRSAKKKKRKRSITESRATTTSNATRVGRSGRSNQTTTSALSQYSYESKVNSLVNASIPLLELFSVVDDVFDEHDAFAPDKIRAGLGRIYRQWKKSRAQLDPEFQERRFEQKDTS